MTVISIICGIALLYVIFTFNSLVRRRQHVREAWSDIETQLKRRYDLIPNLVETVKGYASHETTTLEKVIEARNVAMATKGAGIEKAVNENLLSSALKNLFALSESYPDLKANQNFIELQNTLTDTEDKIQASRRFYNTTVMALNTKIETFPALIVANLFHFKKEIFFELTKEEKDKVAEAPKVSF